MKTDGEKGKILIAGSDGLVGAFLFEYFGKRAIGTSRRENSRSMGKVFLDLREVDRWTPPENIESAVICAGISRINECFEKPEETFEINVEATEKLACRLMEKGSRVLFLSSNQVFDGKKDFPEYDDNVSPVTEYGRQKAETEKRLLEIGGNFVAVLRITKIMESCRPILRKWSGELKANRVISPFKDLFLAPVLLKDLAQAIGLILEKKAEGIFHLSGNKDISYLELAFFLLSRYGKCAKLIDPVSALESDFIRDPFTGKTALGMKRAGKELGLSHSDVDKIIDATVERSGNE